MRKPASPSSSTTSSSASPRIGHRSRHVTCTAHNVVFHDVRARLRLRAATTCRRRTAARERARHLQGHRARRRPGRHAQLRRHLLDRELLRDRGAARSPSISRRSVSLPYPNMDGVVRLHPRPGLRHGNDRRADGHPAPHARRLYPPPQYRGRAGDRARLRAQPDRGIAHRRRGSSDGPCCTLGDAGGRRHAKDDRGRHRRRRRHAAGSPTASKRERGAREPYQVGLQCGGSDGFSSITANPALGAAMDILVRHGGTAILSETPEIYGVEHTLTRRAV